MAATYEEGVAQSLPIDDKGQPNVGLLDTATGKLYHPRRDTGGNMRVALFAANGTTPLVLAEDAPHVSGDPGMLMLAVRRDAAAVGSGTDGDNSTVNVDATGRVWVNSGLAAAVAAGDAMANPTATPVIAHIVRYDPVDAVWVRDQTIDTGTLLVSAARTIATASAQQKNRSYRALRIFLNITVASGTGGLTISVRGYDPISAATYAVDTDAAAIITTGLFVFDISPGNVTGPTSGIRRSIGRIIPRLWDVSIAVGDASSYTYSVAYMLGP